jgi:hypothetical protein
MLVAALHEIFLGNVDEVNHGLGRDAFWDKLIDFVDFAC